MSGHIKTVDLCERCYYAFDRYCFTKHGLDGCVVCDRNEDGKCKCLAILDNTPCPDFMEAEENDRDE